MAIFNDETTDQLKKILSGLKEEINIAYFQQESGCPSCADTMTFLNEFKSLTDKIKVTVYDFQKDNEQVLKYGINKVPAMVVMDKDNTDRKIRIYGTPAGYEINSFLASLFEASGVAEKLPDDISSRIKAIKKDIHIQVFVTPSCPHCPGAVVTAHRLAYENSHIKADMVECSVFPQEATKYNVSGVPKIVINETYELIGNQPITAFLDTIEQIQKN